MSKKDVIVLVSLLAVASIPITLAVKKIIELKKQEKEIKKVLNE